MNLEKAVVFDIEKFAVHDGPGIRTVVFLKGCPLRCLWCHTPESQSARAELLYSAEKCLGCGKCAALCPSGCHAVEGGLHRFDRSRCAGCGKCAEVCPPQALKIAGRRMTVDEVMREVLRDRAFYENSGGGLTISGGEPLSHPEFTRSLLEAAKRNKLHTALETCGFAPWEVIAALSGSVDLWLWDVKAVPEHHRELTGIDSDLILENLRKLDAAGASIVLRCPLISGVNDTEADLAHIAAVANSLKHVRRIDVEPYHPLGENKCRQLGRKPGYSGEFVPPGGGRKDPRRIAKTYLDPGGKKLIFAFRLLLHQKFRQPMVLVFSPLPRNPKKSEDFAISGTGAVFTSLKPHAVRSF